MPTNKGHEHLLFKLKDKLKILIFSYENQNFTEKNYIDKGNFKRELTSEKDIIQLLIIFGKSLSKNFLAVSIVSGSVVEFFIFSTHI